MQNKTTLQAHNEILTANEPWHRGSGFTWMLLALAGLVFFLSGAVAKAETVSYNMGTGNFTTHTQNTGLGANSDPFAGVYNPGGSTSEIAQFANSTWGPEVAVASFRTLTGSATGGTARDLKVGDVFTITGSVATNPNAGGTIGISLNDGTSSSSFSDYNSGSLAQFVLFDGGAWKVNSNSGISEATGLGSGADRTFTLKVTSDRTFNATIGNQNFYDLTFSGGNAATIDSIALWSTVGSSANGGNPWKTDNPDSAWKNASLQNSGTVELGYEAGSGVTRSFSGVISDGQALSSATATANAVLVGGDAGSQVNLSGNNTYTGATTINANATAEAQHANAFGSTSAGTAITGGGVLKLYDASGISYAAEALTVNGTGISDAGALRNVGGNNTWAGAVTLGSNSRISSDVGSLTLSGGISGGSNVLYVGGANATTVSSAISGVGASQNGTTTSLFKDGAGTLTLTGNNTYSGDTRVTAGTLTVNSGGNLGDGSSDVFISSGATLNVNTSLTVDSVQETGNSNGGVIAIGSGATLTVDGASKGTLYQNNISGAGGLTMAGSGDTALGLYGTQSYTGNTTVSGGKISTGVALATAGVTISGGTFETTAADILGSSASASITGGTFSLGGDDTVGSFAISGGQLSGSSTLTAATYALNGGTVTANLGAGTATASSGTTALDGSLGATTVNLSGGTVNLGANNRLADGATLNVSSGTLGMGARTDTVGTLNLSGGSVTGSTGNKLTAATYNLTGGTMGANLGAGTVNANSGTTALNGTVDAATINVGGGTLNLGSGGRLSAGATANLSSGTLSTGGNETITRLNATGGTLNLTGDTLTVTGTNGSSSSVGANVTATGGTISVAGSLDYQSTNGTTALSIASGGTLTGSGTTTGKLTINNEGTLSLGNSPGIMTVGSADWLGGGTYTWEIADFTAGAGPGGHDLLYITGGLLIDAGSNDFIIEVASLLPNPSANFDLYQNYSFAIATAAGGITYAGGGAFDAAWFTLDTSGFGLATSDGNTASPGSWSVSQTGNSIMLNYSGATAIPEPNSAALVLVGLGAALLKRRRRG